MKSFVVFVLVSVLSCALGQDGEVVRQCKDGKCNEKTLVCDTDNICRWIKGTDCTREPLGCRQGLSCDNLVCRKVSGKGQACGADEHDVCQAPLVCLDSKKCGEKPAAMSKSTTTTTPPSDAGKIQISTFNFIAIALSCLIGASQTNLGQSLN